MKPTNSLAPNAKTKKPFSAVISSDGAQKLIRASLRDDGAAKRFTGTLISAVNASDELRDCDAGSIISAALRGEGAGLIYGQGYYVVPFGKKAGYITSYKGWLQLAIATGLYADIDCIEVREGERKGRDARTGKPLVDMSVYDTDEEREKHPIVGVMAYFILKDGYYRNEYWSMGEILDHANRYSQAFSRELYEKWQRGEKLTEKETYKIEKGSPWYTATLRMAKKTVLKSLLTSGFAPLSNEVKSLLDSESASGEAVIPDFFDDTLSNDDVVDGTGEVIDADVVQEAAEPSESTEASAKGNNTTKVEKPAPAKRGRPKKVDKPAEQEEAVEVEVVTVDDDDYESSFFGE